MYSWNSSDENVPKLFKYSNLIVFGSAAGFALLMAFLLNTYYDELISEHPYITNLLFAPAFGIGFLYGLKISERALQPSETRSALKRKIMKLFLFFLVIGGLFSSVNFALHGGAMMPDASLVDDGVIPWITDMITANGGAMYQMNRFTSNLNTWEDYMNGQ